jgi:hypothetical protein
MRDRRRDAARFVLLALPLLAVNVALYVLGIDAWESAVVRAANALLAPLPRPYLLEVEPGGALAFYAVVADGARKLVTPRPHGVYLSLALVPALLLATPARLADRCKWILIALPIVFATHVVAVLAMYRAHLVLREGASVPWEVLFALATRSGQLCAIALWALFTWRFWIR